MRFLVEGTRHRRIVIDIEEDISGEVEVSKKDVMAITDCPAKEDGDSSAWYGYVEQALQEGVRNTVTKDTKVTVRERTEREQVNWEDIEVDW